MMITAQQTNASGYALRFDVDGTPGPADQTFRSRVLFPHIGGGVTVEVAGLNSGDPRQMVQPDGSQIEPGSWNVGDELTWRYVPSEGRFHFLGRAAPSADGEMTEVWRLDFDNPDAVSRFYQSKTGSTIDDLEFVQDGEDTFARCHYDGSEWWDPNHGDVGFLKLGPQSWVGPGDPGAPSTKIGYPPIHDLRGAEIRFVMRAREMVKPRTAKILLLAQARDRLQEHWPDVTVQRSMSNHLQIADPISNGLRFNYLPYDQPDPVRGVHDSGWQEIRVRMSTDPAHWLPLGGVAGRQGMDDDPQRYYNYVVAPPEEFLARFDDANLFVVLYMPGPSHPGDDCLFRGSIDMRSVSIWKPAT